MAAILKKSRDPVTNDLMLDRLSQAKRAVTQLKREGFEVIAVNIDQCRPLLSIQSCSRCARLIDEGRAIYYRWQMVGGVREQVARFELEGCGVTWTERGN